MSANKSRASGGIRDAFRSDRESTFWRVMVKHSVDGQWQLFIKRGGQVVLVGETRKSKSGVIKTAMGLVEAANVGGLFHYDGVIA